MSWQWFNGKQWETYDDETQWSLTRAHASHTASPGQSVRLPVMLPVTPRHNAKRVEFEFFMGDPMVQRNISTGTERLIRRLGTTKVDVDARATPQLHGSKLTSTMS